jgi:hypothetical protein
VAVTGAQASAKVMNFTLDIRITSVSSGEQVANPGECEVVHTSLLFRLLKSGIAIWSLPRGGKMARQPDSLGFRFALVLALAVIVLALTTWLGTASKWAAPIPASEPVYRAQHLNLF